MNQAADQYVRAEDVRPPAGPLRSRSAEEDETDGGLAATVLAECYDGFRRDEITARELGPERSALIRAFNNDIVRAGNIRYRAMLRAELPT